MKRSQKIHLRCNVPGWRKCVESGDGRACGWNYVAVVIHRTLPGLAGLGAGAPRSDSRFWIMTRPVRNSVGVCRVRQFRSADRSGCLRPTEGSGIRAPLQVNCQMASRTAPFTTPPHALARARASSISAASYMARKALSAAAQWSAMGSSGIARRAGRVRWQHPSRIRSLTEPSVPGTHMIVRSDQDRDRSPGRCYPPADPGRDHRAGT